MARTPEKIRKAHAADVKAVKELRDLSPEGLKRRLARVHQQYALEMEKYRAEQAVEREQRYETLYRRMFGNPTSGDPASAINFRDAQERAERVKDPADARRLLARAHAAGDTALSKALAMRALELAGTPTGNGWIPLINEWAEVNGVDDELTEISTLMGQRSDMERTGMTWTLPAPDELRGKDRGQINALAKAADAEDDGGGTVVSFNSSRPGETSWLPETG